MCSYRAQLFVLLALLACSEAQSLNLNLLHTFVGVPDGNQPLAGLYLDGSGNLYGTTGAGGDENCPGNSPYGCGTVFKVDANGTYSVLYTFLGNVDGGFPVASLVEDRLGNLYGTTEGLNGAASTVFKLDSAGNKTVLHTFSNIGPDGGAPTSAPIVDTAGNIFGTTPVDGDNRCGFGGMGCGVIYGVNAAGQFQVLHTFRNVTDGDMPGVLTTNGKGTIYGVTSWGGDMSCSSTGCGTVFKLDSSGFQVLYRFHGKQDGSYPTNVVSDKDGNLYGITNSGGDLGCYAGKGCGTIFRIDMTGRFKVLFTFTPNLICCAPEYNTLIRDASGNLYDTTPFNGPHNGGFLFEIDTKGNFSDLFDFPNQNSVPDGKFVNSIVRDSRGNFYGTMQLGGESGCGRFADGCGTVFALKR